MNSLPFVLQLIALILVLLAALNIPSNSRISWGWLGLAFWFLSFMLGGFVLHQASSIH